MSYAWTMVAASASPVARRSPGSVSIRPTCHACGERLQVGLNWRPCPRPGGRPAFNYICRPCDRADNHRRARTPTWRFRHSKMSARRRGVRWGLTFPRYAKFLAQLCHYCGGALSETGIGLDRQDARLGYFAANVVSACGACLALKGRHLTPAELKAILVARAINAQVACM